MEALGVWGEQVCGAALGVRAEGAVWDWGVPGQLCVSKPDQQLWQSRNLRGLDVHGLAIKDWGNYWEA